jgi:signal transduction histidine kinase
MDTEKSAFFNLIKRKESLLFFVLFIAGISLIGWLSGNNHIASFSMKYLPIAPSSLVMFITLVILFLIDNKIGKSELTISLSTIAIIIDAVYCGIIFLEYLFNLTWDIEYILIKNPEMLGKVPMGRMSPISSVLFIFICIGVLGIRQNNTNIIRYISGSFSLLTGLISSVLLIGYLYNAPLLYGSIIIPVSLPSAICFLLFSITLLRVSEAKFWTFNLLKDNKVTRQLLRSFLPIVVFIVILQGFLDNVLSFNDINPPLTSALILFSVVFITVLIVFRVSSISGSQLLRAEEALKENEKQLLQLNADKDRFLQILGHDLISPFNTLLGYSELLLADIRKLKIDEIEDRLNDINIAAQNSYNLLSDILMWTRAQSGKIPFNPQKLNFATTCKDMLDTLNPTANAKKITINYLATDQIFVFADIDMLKTVLRNLVSNAIKFTGNGGAINISTKENSENATISVSDNGIGIKAENIIKLFDISQVISTSGTANETGTGLGLLLCKEFVEKHGGKIWVESETGKGSDFKFTLPVFTSQHVE